MTPTRGPDWDADFARRSPIFGPLRAVADRLPSLGWPNAEVLNAIGDETGKRMVNARGQHIGFVASSAAAKPGFEQRTYESGELEVRPVDWHDLLNALVWMTFPLAKAAINARHCLAMEAEAQPERSPLRDALTHFDEDGVIVLSGDPELSQLLRNFAWKELFWKRRAEAIRAMRFLVFGHALYDKARSPFIGMTGKALIFDVAPAVLEQECAGVLSDADRLAALHVLSPERMLRPSELGPVPLLGVPGWWEANEAADFYDNTAYFRPGRSMAQRR